MASCKRKPKDCLETKLIFKEKSEEKETAKGFADSLQRRVELFETNSDQANLMSVKETVEGLDQTPHFVEEATVREKTLFIAHLSYKTKIADLVSDIIDFFKNVGKVVRVQLIVNRHGKPKSYGFVEFASANEANKVLQKKNGEYLHGRKIFLCVAKIDQYPPKYCIDYKVWYEDYLRQESLLIEDDLETKPNLKKPKMGRFCGKKTTFSDDCLPRPIEEDETRPRFVEEVLFVANLSPQTEISHIINLFNHVGEVVSVRLIVNHEGKHVGYGFVEFVSANEAKKALEKKNGEYLHDHKIFLVVAKTAPYPPRPKYNLVEKLCYEDYLRRESLLVEEDATVEGLDKTPVSVKAVAIRKKMVFFANLPHKTIISDIISNVINFFKDVGKVVHFRLIVNREGNHLGCGFVEFASAYEAKKALEKKNGKYLLDREIVLEVAKIAPPPKYWIDHMVWYEDYLRRESLLIEENEALEGLDEIDFVEEVTIRKKTLFVANVPCETKLSEIISNIFNFFKKVGEVVHVRLIVNHRGEPVGCGFVEFASVNEAKKVLQKKNDECNRIIFLDVPKTAPYPLRPKYNLAEKICSRYEESLLIEEDDLEPQSEFCGTKITFSDDD